MDFDFSKKYFQRSWGVDGYYEKFSYGVGYEKVCQICLDPFFDKNKTALEVGCGGGTFTERMIGKFEYLTVIDVIQMPKQFSRYQSFKYIELDDKSYDCSLVSDNTKDFCFCYNLFCHLSNEAIKEYIKNIHRVLRPGSSFVFMLANFEHSKAQLDSDRKFELGDILPFGHFYQDDRTLDIVVDSSQWEIETRNMIPSHRDIIVHLKKK